MIVEERSPGLRRRLTVADHILRDRRLGDVDAQHLQLAVNSRSTPANVFSGHAPNELTNFRWDRATTAPAWARFPPPIETKALAVPTH